MRGTGNVLDGQWHHIAVQRSRPDGRLSIFVDGRQDGTDASLTGDISYPDGVDDVTFRDPPTARDSPAPGAVPCHRRPHCARRALTWRSQKAAYPSFNGWLDETCACPRLCATQLLHSTASAVCDR